MELEKSKTWQNLEMALNLECKAYCEYFFYSQQAKKDGYVQIGDIFNETAQNELHHAKLLFKKLHGDKVPGTLENLKAARESEEIEGIEAYQNAAKVAKEEGFDGLSEWFEELSKIELSHKDRYDTLIERVENDEVFKRDEIKVWYCTVCGHLHIGKEPPEKCPVCEHPQGHFEIKAENY